MRLCRFYGGISYIIPKIFNIIIEIIILNIIILKNLKIWQITNFDMGLNLRKSIFSNRWFSREPALKSADDIIIFIRLYLRSYLKIARKLYFTQYTKMPIISMFLNYQNISHTKNKIIFYNKTLICYDKLSKSINNLFQMNFKWLNLFLWVFNFYLSDIL